MSEGAIEAHLLSGERMVWSGRPSAGLLFSGRDIFLIPFSLLWCGFAIFWTVTAMGTQAPSFFDLWGLMFVGIGLFFVFGRFLADAWVRSRTLYAITSQRILISRSGPFASFVSLNLDRLPELQFSPKADGRGTIRFGASPSIFSRGNSGFGTWIPSLDTTPQFIAINDAGRVYELVQRAVTPRS